MLTGKNCKLVSYAQWEFEALNKPLRGLASSVDKFVQKLATICKLLQAVVAHTGFEPTASGLQALSHFCTFM